MLSLGFERVFCNDILKNNRHSIDVCMTLVFVDVTCDLFYLWNILMTCMFDIVVMNVIYKI